ncbi:MAG: acetate uptake transporter [Fibromonadaceae bacterium]|jgi:succinate-acetate transporter protein|nr:acetate uptake transporter [Fibromonadaceae bacterium]
MTDTNIKETQKRANPGPLGLIGFGLTTVLLNLKNAGVIELSIMIAAMGFAVGGLAQIIAGILEFREKSTFGGTAFTAYGFFWISLVVIWVNPSSLPAADLTSMGFYLLVWGTLTVFMFICTFKHSRVTRFVFGSLVLLFFMLAIGDFTQNETITRIAGVIGIICGSSALYSAVAQLINEEFGRVIFPL